MSDISKKTLKKIKEDEVQPYSKKRFFLKKSFIWILFGASLFLGLVASSVVVFQLKHSDWDLYHRSSYSFFAFLALAMPYFWILFLMVFKMVWERL